MTMPALLEVRDLRTQFVMPQGPITVVDGVSFDLEAGRNAGGGRRIRLRQVGDRVVAAAHPARSRKGV